MTCPYIGYDGKACNKEIQSRSIGAHFYNCHKMRWADWRAGVRPKAPGEAPPPEVVAEKDVPKHEHHKHHEHVQAPAQGKDLDDILDEEIAAGHKPPSDPLDALAVDPGSCADLFTYGAELLDDIGVSIKEHLDKVRPGEPHRYKVVRMPESRARTLGKATSEIVGPQDPKVVLAVGATMAYIPSVASILFMIAGPKVKAALSKFAAAAKAKAKGALPGPRPPKPGVPPDGKAV